MNAGDHLVCIETPAGYLNTSAVQRQVTVVGGQITIGVDFGLALAPTATPTASATVTSSATPTATETPTATSTATATATPTATPTASQTATPTASPTVTASPTETLTPTPTATSGPTLTPTPQLATVQGRVCLDADHNGRCDPGEAGLAGVTVQLDPATVGLRLHVGHTTLTDAAGRFVFADLAPGRYTLGIQAPAGYWVTTAITVDVGPALHQTLEAAFGLYWPASHHYLPLVWR